MNRYVLYRTEIVHQRSKTSRRAKWYRCDGPKDATGDLGGSELGTEVCYRDASENTCIKMKQI